MTLSEREALMFLYAYMPIGDITEEQMRRYKLDQLRVNSQTKLSDMAMQIKVSAMKLSRMKVELRSSFSSSTSV